MVLCKQCRNFDRKLVKMKCIVKEKEDQIAFNKSPTIFNKEKNKTQGSCSFPSKKTLPNMEWVTDTFNDHIVHLQQKWRV